MIDWKEFKKLIGNKKRKYIRGAKGKYHFVSYNDELKEVTLMNTKATRTLSIYSLEHFIKDFNYVGMSNEKPLF